MTAYLNIGEHLIPKLIERMEGIQYNGRTVPVYARIGDQTDFPYITIGVSSQPPAIGKNAYVYRYSQTINVWDAYKSGGDRKKVEEIANLVVQEVFTRYNNRIQLDTVDMVGVSPPEIEVSSETWDKMGAFVYVADIRAQFFVHQKH